jgi:hypothetical protein
MKTSKLLITGLLVLAALFMVHGEACAKLPGDFQESKARYEKEARTEQGALHLFFEAVYCYLKAETRDEASKMLRYALYASQPIERTSALATFVTRMKDESLHHIFRSYAVGATPENNYSMSPDDFKFEVTRRTKHPNGDVDLYIRCSGADSPRPVRMRQHDGLWYTNSVGSIITKIREPKNVIDAKRNAHDADYDTEPEPVKEKTPEPEEKTEKKTDGETDIEDDSGGSLPDLW